MGGIYLDIDILVIQSFDKFRKFDLTLGLESDHSICNAIIISTSTAPGLIPWLRSFAYDFRTHRRTYNAIEVI